MKGHRTIHEVLDVKSFAIGRERQSLRSTSHIKAENLSLGPGISHHDLAVSFQCGEEKNTRGIKSRSARDAGVVVVDATGQVFG